MIDPWEAAGHDPPIDPFPGSGSWDVCVVGSCFDERVQPKRLYGWQVAKMLGEPIITSRKERVPLWLPVRVNQREDGTLGKTNEDVESISMFVVDSDSGIELDVLRALGATEDYDLLRFGHTSYSHSTSKTKGRVVFPMLEPVPARRWLAVWEAGTRWAASCGVVNDKATKNPSRLWYKPSAPRTEDFHYWQTGGTKGPTGARLWNGQALLDPAWLIRTFPPPKVEKPRPRERLTQAYAALGRPEDRERAIASSWLNAKLTKLSVMAPGAGQSTYTYSCGRSVGQAVNGGYIYDSTRWEQLFVQAAISVGLSEKRARSSFCNGFNTGQTEVWQDVIDAARK
jgi:hypothetical protein